MKVTISEDKLLDYFSCMGAVSRKRDSIESVLDLLKTKSRFDPILKKTKKSCGLLMRFRSNLNLTSGALEIRIEVESATPKYLLGDQSEQISLDPSDLRSRALLFDIYKELKIQAL